MFAEQHLREFEEEEEKVIKPGSLVLVNKLLSLLPILVKTT